MDQHETDDTIGTTAQARIRAALSALPYGAGIVPAKREALSTGQGVADVIDALAARLRRAADVHDAIRQERDDLASDVAAFRRVVGTVAPR